MENFSPAVAFQTAGIHDRYWKRLVYPARRAKKAKSSNVDRKKAGPFTVARDILRAISSSGTNRSTQLVRDVAPTWSRRDGADKSNARPAIMKVRYSRKPVRVPSAGGKMSLTPTVQFVCDAGWRPK